MSRGNNDISTYIRNKKLEVGATISTANSEAGYIQVKDRHSGSYNPGHNIIVPPYIPPVIIYKYKQLTPVAGVLNDGTETVNGFGTNAKFQSISHIFTVEKDIYIIDRSYYHIRKYNGITGEVTTYVGPDSVGSPTIVTDLIIYPECGTYDPDSQTMFIGQTNNYLKINMRTNTISKITISLAGVTSPTMSSITYKSGILYCMDTQKNIVFQINVATNETSLIAGSPNNAGFVDGIGTNARFNISQLFSGAITVDNKKNLYIGDRNNNAIRKINLKTLEVSTFLRTSFNLLVVLYSSIDDTLYYSSTFKIGKLYLKRPSDNEIVYTNDDGLTSLAVTDVNTLYDGSSRKVLYKYT